ncbi:MAG: flagellar hook-length control protein FliK, partial [Roseiarcus sp.]
AGGAGAAAPTPAAGSPANAPVKELDVKLNPASLGGLTIEMRLSDGKLAVTIRADKSDTMKLIQSESGAISDRLQSLNFSVESLTVKASDGATSAPAGPDASNAGSANNGAAQQGQSGQAEQGARDGRPLGGDGRSEPGAPARDGSGEPGGLTDLGERLF